MELINKLLGGWIVPIFLVIFGLIFAIKFKFFYILHPIKAVKSMLKNKNGGFKSLSVALAGTLGIGNIVGVASAIIMGGAGSIFWMWISAILAMSLKYAEVKLAMRFRRGTTGKFHGGAFYYINDGLKEKTGAKAACCLSCAFALLCMLNSLSTGNLVQINSVSQLLPMRPIIFGVIFTALAFLIIIGGYKRISKITSYLIPILTIIYVTACILIVFHSFDKLPQLLAKIFKDAFSLKSATCGFCGYGILAAIRYGVSRGLLSNEAGCGTSPCAHASSESHDSHAQGCLGIFEVFVDSILLCTLTAFVILLSDVYKDSPTALVISSFEKFLGSFGGKLVLILSILFAFATVICQFFYGIEALEYISSSKAMKAVFLFVFCLVLLIGSIIPMTLMWQISDLVLAIMTVFNVIILFTLRHHIQK